MQGGGPTEKSPEKVLLLALPSTATSDKQAGRHRAENKTGRHRMMKRPATTMMRDANASAS
jgi:hypothetical protein